MKNLSSQISGIIPRMQNAQAYTLFERTNFGEYGRTILINKKYELKAPLTLNFRNNIWIPIFNQNEKVSLDFILNPIPEISKKYNFLEKIWQILRLKKMI